MLPSVCLYRSLLYPVYLQWAEAPCQLWLPGMRQYPTLLRIPFLRMKDL